ncbi:MAG: hypothetical protein JWM80_2854 [Cyanobacteria bacterium RYN_339]|nr:hypothetical protein [Cyanobacteria bacterium RYN_339]
MFTTLAAYALIAAAPAVDGTVTDARSGRPLAAVFVQQEGGLASTFSNAEGAFTLTLDGADKRITFTASGYVRLTVPAGKGLKVKLVPLDAVTPGSAPTLKPEYDPNAPTQSPPALASAVRLAYRLRYETATAGNATVAGAGNNDYRIGLRYRWSPWLVEADGAHVQIPVDVAGLPREQNPAMSPSTYEAAARAAYVWPLGAWEPALGLGYRYRNTVPNNKDVPFTGSDLDFEQTHHALGVVGMLGWRPASGPWSAELGLQAYPLVYAWAKEPGLPYAGQFGAEGYAGVAYEIVNGLRLGLDYRLEVWRGSGQDVSHILGLQFQYTPSGMMKGR